MRSGEKEVIDAMSDSEKLRWQGDLALIAEAAKEAGAVSIGGQTLFLAGSTRDVFFD